MAKLVLNIRHHKSIVDADSLVLKHQGTTIHNADRHQFIILYASSGLFY